MFRLKENGTNVRTEIVAGVTTFFAMAYILFINPSMLMQTGIPEHAVFLATIFASVAGTLVMALFANVPYAQAPGMGLNAFFTYTVCYGLGFSWQEGLAMVFLCGVINIIITVTKLRKYIIKAIPVSLQHAIGGGIGIFVAYIGFKTANLLSFNVGVAGNVSAAGDVLAFKTVPSIASFATWPVVFAAVSLVFTAILVIKKVPGALLIGIVVSTILGLITKVKVLPESWDFFGDISGSFNELGQVFGKALTVGLPDLFSSGARIPTVLLTIFAFSLSDTFDTIGTFIGTGRKSGIFSDADMFALENSKGFKSKMDKALFSDSVATSVGAIFGTSNTTTYVESAAGIGVGGRTGLTSLTTAILFLASIVLAPVVGLIPAQATAPALIIVGIMMLSSFTEIKWNDLEEAIPAFFAGIFMALCYSITTGIAGAFIFYCIIKVLKGKAKEVHPVLWVATALFLANFVILAVI
ncbi:MAG: NCS2 family permease [Oscillospiraceae bacterium]|jgi:AGZA family xanthine/uracil permease-like MFS transporter|nr:NCS2 family permease [Oscillospiraceae bacterium]